MKRLTVHIKHANKERVEIKPKGSKEPIKKEKIFNTISVRYIPTEEQAKKHLQEIRSQHTIASWESGKKRGQEMIYIANEK